MPTSVPYAIPIVACIARQLRPATVLDIGVGFGKYGYLFREYTDIWDMTTVGDYDRSQWKTRIEGIEATAEYLTPMHRYLYDDIHVGDVRTVLDSLPQYDVIIMGDVLEHFTKGEGDALLDRLYAHANQCVLLTFPRNCAINHNVLGNPYEAHRSPWDVSDFRRFPRVAHRLLEDYSALVAIAVPPHDPPLLTPSFAARRRTGWKGAVTRWAVSMLGATPASRLASWFLRRNVTLRT